MLETVMSVEVCCFRQPTGGGMARRGCPTAIQRVRHPEIHQAQEAGWYRQFVDNNYVMMLLAEKKRIPMLEHLNRMDKPYKCLQSQGQVKNGLPL